MRHSVTLVASDQSLPVTELARAVESRDLHGLWLPDHSHTPVARPDPLVRHGRHERMLDPVVGLAMASAATERIRVGTGVLLAGQRDPIATAKALASIDQQSAGRLAVGVGYGWDRDELADHGIAMPERWERMREHVLVMRRIWEDEVAEFHGRHVQLNPSASWPKPMQHPLPLLLGAAPNPRTFGHIAEFGTGWIPRGGAGLHVHVPALREAVAAAGRDPDELEVVSFSDGTCDDGKADHLERAGVTEVAYDVPFHEPPRVLDALDRIALFVARRGRR